MSAFSVVQSVPRSVTSNFCLSRNWESKRSSDDSILWVFLLHLSDEATQTLAIAYIHLRSAIEEAFLKRSWRGEWTLCSAVPDVLLNRSGSVYMTTVSYAPRQAIVLAQGHEAETQCGKTFGISSTQLARRSPQAVSLPRMSENMQVRNGTAIILADDSQHLETGTMFCRCDRHFFQPKSARRESKPSSSWKVHVAARCQYPSLSMTTWWMTGERCWELQEVLLSHPSTDPCFSPHPRGY
jgi:hypothetical protein